VNFIRPLRVPRNAGSWIIAGRAARQEAGRQEGQDGQEGRTGRRAER
jgi:hypothetical protein